MAKINKDDFKFEIEEVIGLLKESDKNDWCKAVARISWNDRPATFDIRTMNFSKPFAGKGISLSDEEVDRLTDILLENDFGTLDSLARAIEKKRSRFTILGDVTSAFAPKDENDMYNIIIE